MATPVEDTVVHGENDTSGPSLETSPLPGYSDVNEFSQKALRNVLKATRSSNNLPVGDDFDFYSTFRSVRDVMDIEGQRILSLLKRLLRSQNVRGNLSHGDAVELDDQFDVLMDANDQILERAGSLLDEASGIRKEETKLVITSVAMNQPKPTSSWNKKTPTKPSTVSYSLMTARNIQRPQLKFKDKIDNTSLPFRPQLRSKPNAIKTLEESLRLPEGVQPEDLERPDFKFPNPYQAEIDAFVPSPQCTQRVTPVEPKPAALTPLIMVSTEQQLNDMMTDLVKQKEIAVDLEHHSYRSYQGVTCLIQISTRSHDYIVDALGLRSHLYVINSVFTDPSITKILHGADSDIAWLQRDFGVYIVNLFDTGQASRVLGMTRFSLAHLLMRYCKVEADKQYQLADWRIRPLPDELINYAREDTHFLLYIYDMMRNELLDRGNSTANLLVSVYERSKAVASKVYQKPGSREDDHLELYKRSKKIFNNQQLSALQELHAWRDATARIEDESLGYVLPNHMLLQIAEILPRERQGVLACCNPVPPLVRQSIMEIHAIVMAAREVALVKVEKRPVLQPSAQQHPRYHIDSLLSCPHDTSHLDNRSHLDVKMEIDDTLDESLLSSTGSMFAINPVDIVLKASPSITAYAWAEQNLNNVRKASRFMADRIKAAFSNPFAKYMPKDLRDGVLVKREDVWVMKPSNTKSPSASTEVGKKRSAEEAGQSSDSPVDLHSFQPEFVPSAKRTKMTSDGVSTTKSIFAVPAVPTQALGGSAASADIVSKKIKSLRDEVNIKKKKLKKELKMKEKRKKKKADDQAASETSLSSSQQPSDANTNNSVPETSPLPLADTKEEISDSVDAQSSAVSVTSIKQKKKEKKNKKKKLTMEDVEANIGAFDYAAAEKELQKKKKEKTKVDIYNPALPSRSGKDKNKVKKPKLSSANSNKLVSFGPSVGGQGKKGKK